MGLLLSRSVCLALGRLTLVLSKCCCIYSTGYAPIFGGVGCGRSRGSVVIGTSIFVFLAPHLVSVPIFIENWTFLNFGGVGHGCGRSTGRRLSGSTFSDLAYRI